MQYLHEIKVVHDGLRIEECLGEGGIGELMGKNEENVEISRAETGQR